MTALAVLPLALTGGSTGLVAVCAAVAGLPLAAAAASQYVLTAELVLPTAVTESFGGRRRSWRSASERAWCSVGFWSTLATRG